MVFKETERVQSPEAMLKEAGFSVSERCCARPSCFDLVARRNSTVFLIKIQRDIDNFSQADSLELHSIAECVPATSLLIGEKSRDNPLEDDTVYSRYEVLAVTSKSFENIVIRKTHPLIHAGPGGYYVEIDQLKIKRRRQELGLSVGEMAEMVGLSRRTLYGYERGMAKASVAAAYNIVYTLGVPIAKPVDVFEQVKNQHKCFLKARFTIARSGLLQKIFRKFACYRITTVRKAPFDFILSAPEEKIKIIGGVANDREQALEKRVDEILSVSRIMKAHPVLITEEKSLENKDIAYIGKDELSKIRNPQDLIAKL